MGYCYGYTRTGSHARTCDNCGNAGGTRLRHCPHMVSSSNLRSQSGKRYALHYCPAPSLCSACYAEHKDTLHTDCAHGAARSQAEHDAEQERLDRGEHRLIARWGDWHKDVPDGLIGCAYAGSGYADQRHVLVTAEAARAEWLEDLPAGAAQPWPEGATA